MRRPENHRVHANLFFFFFFFFFFGGRAHDSCTGFWRFRVREAAVAASAQPDVAFDWSRAVWDKDTVEEDLRDPKGFATLDAKVRSAVTNILG